MTNNQKAAVIGAGVGGLATAIRLRALGYEVDLFEQEQRVGGKLMEMHRDRFRFDMGPSLFTQPERVEELFTLMGEDPRQHFSYKRLDTICRYFFSDGSSLEVPSDPEEFISKVRTYSGTDADRLKDYLRIAKKLYETASPLFIEQPFPTRKGLMSAEGQAIGRQPWLLDPFTSLHRRNKNSFRDKRLVQLFDRYATYNGSNPYKAPATLKMIAHLEHNLGAYFPEGGMYGIATSLGQLAARHGVKIHLGTRVDEIVTDVTNRRVTGLTINGDFAGYDLVVSDVDVHTLYRKLLKGISPPAGNRRLRLSTSAIIFYWGIRGEHPGLDLHNILFSEDYAAEFKSLFKNRTLQPDPTIYLFISKRLVPDDAPEGDENWFVMINAPENRGQDWNLLVSDARKKVIEKIQRMLGIEIENRIITEHVEDPRTIEARTGSYRGALYGNNSNSRFSAFSRHPNHRKILGNMYYVGGSVHPGGGIPLCLASAKIVSNLLTTSPPGPLSQGRGGTKK